MPLKYHETHILEPDVITKAITEAKDPRTKALISFQYFFGRRAGELARDYKHKEETKEGLLMEHIHEYPYKFTIRMPNFKNPKNPYLNNPLPKMSNIPLERFLIEKIVYWINANKNSKYLFNIRKTRIRDLIDAELKKQRPEASTHWLRHSRITLLTEDYEWTLSQVQKFIGHGWIESTAHYSHADIEQAMFKGEKAIGVKQ